MSLYIYDSKDHEEEYFGDDAKRKEKIIKQTNANYYSKAYNSTFKECLKQFDEQLSENEHYVYWTNLQSEFLEKYAISYSRNFTYKRINYTVDKVEISYHVGYRVYNDEIHNDYADKKTTRLTIHGIDDYTSEVVIKAIRHNYKSHEEFEHDSSLLEKHYEAFLQESKNGIITKGKGGATMEFIFRRMISLFVLVFSVFAFLNFIINENYSGFSDLAVIKSAFLYNFSSKILLIFIFSSVLVLMIPVLLLHHKNSKDLLGSSKETIGGHIVFMIMSIIMLVGLFFNLRIFTFVSSILCTLDSLFFMFTSANILHSVKKNNSAIKEYSEFGGSDAFNQLEKTFCSHIISQRFVLK